MSSLNGPYRKREYIRYEPRLLHPLDLYGFLFFVYVFREFVPNEKDGHPGPLPVGTIFLFESIIVYMRSSVVLLLTKDGAGPVVSGSLLVSVRRFRQYSVDSWGDPTPVSPGASFHPESVVTTITLEGGTTVVSGSLFRHKGRGQPSLLLERGSGEPATGSSGPPLIKW